jgi:hypothetical protein
MSLTEDVKAAIIGYLRDYISEYGDANNKAREPALTLKEHEGISPNGFYTLEIKFTLEDLDAVSLHGLANVLNFLETLLHPLGLDDVLLESYFPNEEVTIHCVGWLMETA